MKGETHTYEDHDNNNEKIHLMVKDFTFGYSIDHIARVAKIVLQLFLPKTNLGGDFAVSAFIEKETNYEFRDGKEVY